MHPASGTDEARPVDEIAVRVPSADELAVEGAKRTLRQAVLFRRDARAVEQRERDDAGRMSIIESVLADRLPDTVAAYLSTGAEPGSLQLVAWLAAQNIRVLLPVLSDSAGTRLSGPAWAAYGGPDHLRVGRQSILEPTTELVPAEQLPEAELIVCPGLAANLSGDRLGRGGGWYDRALGHAGQSTPVWLLLNDDEVLETIPTLPWDRRVDVILTPTRMITCDPPVHSPA